MQISTVDARGRDQALLRHLIVKFDPAAAEKANLPVYQGEESIEVPVEVGGKALLDLEPEDCRFPISESDETEARFCGAKRLTTKSYCDRHCKMAYRAWVKK